MATIERSPREKHVYLQNKIWQNGDDEYGITFISTWLIEQQ